MIPRRRLFNRSQTGPVPLECDKSYGRSVSANSSTRSERVSSTGSCTPVTLVRAREMSASLPQSQSMDSGLVSLPSPIQPTFSVNKMPSASGLIQVHEFIYLGNAEVASKMQENCQNNIRCFVNVSEKSGSTMRSSQSWSCLDKTANKTELTVSVPYRNNIPIKELFEMFTMVNDVIRQARNKAQRVLIYSEDGLAACQAFALAYNIDYYHLDLDHALCNFERLSFKIEINDFLRDALIKWATICEENRVREMANSRRAEWKETRPATVDCAVKRVAWQ
ncbi:dual specificity phosphatase, catalytic domain protein [Teladorsagia circumcincta]|uniref:Dual specificity phosphatase, catalytic domain protein n=1 Tax=Teladorsagia circumcincta TaxID=45464 RepID=A0A2G9UI01_TELCI|nr:dual specificity phosphatase, catalytic domain protein [Teladorsagia circumcincta]